MTDFDSFAIGRKNCYSAEGGFLFWEISRDSGDVSCLFDDETLFVHLLVWNGEILLSCNGEERRASKGSFVNYVGANSFGLVSATADAQACLMLYTESYTNELVKNNPPLPFRYVMRMHENPVMRLNGETMAHLRSRMDLLKEICSNQSNLFRNELIRCASMMFLFDLSNRYIMHNPDDTEPGEMNISRSKRIFMDFAKCLKQNVRKEHSVNFYSSELCMTPQYLNRMVKAFSGKTAREWICLELISEITSRLERQDMSIQAIAEELNFPNQASLAKFFKRLTGDTLSSYKKRSKSGPQGSNYLNNSLLLG